MATKQNRRSASPERRRTAEPFTLVDMPASLPPHLVFADPLAASRKTTTIPEEFELGSSTSVTCGLPLPGIGGGKIKKIWGALRRENSTTSSIGGSHYEDAIDDEWEDIVDEACYPHLSNSNCRLQIISENRRSNMDLLSHLPYEVASYVLTFLPFHSILAASAVSSSWRTLASGPALWKILFEKEPGWMIKPGYLSSMRSKGLEIPWRELYFSRWELSQRWRDRRFMPVQRVLEGHTDSVYCIEYLPELYHPNCPNSEHFCDIPNVVITGSRDHSIRMWDLDAPTNPSEQDGQGWSEGPLLKLERHSGSVLCIQFDKTGFMASGSSDTTILIWDLGWAKQKITFPLSRPAPVDSAVHPEQRMKLGPHIIRRRPRALKQLRGHTGGVLDLKFNEKWIASCSKDSTLALHSRETLELVYTLSGHDGPVNSIGLRFDQLVSASGDGRIILWDLGDKHGKQIRTLDGHEKGLACVIFKNDVILSGSNDKKIKLWSASTGACRQTYSGHKGLVRALAYQEDSPIFVSASYDRSVRIWELEDDSGKPIREFRGQHSSHIFRVGADATRIISSSHDKKVVVLDFAAGLPSDLGHVFY